jgi:type II secretory pathway pseudopilin PulG
MRGRAGDAGYVLFGIVIGIVILGVFMGAAVPLWQKVVQREREQELIWRGYQYMQAIELYQKKFPGAYPPSIEVLVEQKFLRKAYTDPMAENEKGEWKVLRQLSPELQPGAQAPGQDPSSGLTPLNRSRAQTRAPGSAVPGPPGATRPLAGSQFQSSLGRGDAGAALGGVVGVASTSEERTFYQVPGKEKYKDWLFVWGGQTAVVPGVPGQQPGLPGQPVAPGQGVPGASPFPGLPPPPTVTSIGLQRGAAVPGATPPQGVPPGQIVPGPGEQPGQPGTGPGGFPQPRPPQQGQQQQQRRPPG